MGMIMARHRESMLWRIEPDTGDNDCHVVKWNLQCKAE